MLIRIPDKIYLKMLYWLRLWKRLNLEKPQTFSEKIQWLKIHDRNSAYSKMCDKYLVKEYVANIIWKNYIIPTLWIRNNPDEIEWDTLPNKFVLKCTHDSGSIIICENIDDFDRNKAMEKLRKSIKRKSFYQWREFAYKKIVPRIIAEEYMVDESGVELKDYKVFCFGGEPKIIQVDYGRFSNHKRNIYDLNRNFLPFEILFPSDESHKIKKPKCLTEMLNLAKKLSDGIPFVRVDFYVINEQIYFWETTFYPWNWMEEFTPIERDFELWERINLPHIESK